jgi:hypothetical protein
VVRKALEYIQFPFLKWPQIARRQLEAKLFIMRLPFIRWFCSAINRHMDKRRVMQGPKV